MSLIKKKDIPTEIVGKRNSFLTSLVADSSETDTQIEVLIREKYSLSQEIAIHRKHMMGTLSTDKWTEYCSYVQECIDKVESEEE